MATPTPQTPTSSHQTFESFPSLPEEPEPQVGLAEKLLGFFTSAVSTPAPTASPAPPPGAKQPSDKSSEDGPNTNSSSASSQSARATNDTNRTPIASTSAIPFPSTSTGDPDGGSHSSYPSLPNGRRVVRPIRLSGVSPSVLVSLNNSSQGDLVQQSSRSSIRNESHSHSHSSHSHPIPLSSGALAKLSGSGSVYGSPTTSEGLGGSLARFGAFPGLSRMVGVSRRQDDNVSVYSSSTAARPANASVANVFRKLRGEGLSKDYWIKDENATSCFDCQSAFTAFRRKHHCRVCGQIFCSPCASNIISSVRFGRDGTVRVCNLCLAILQADPDNSNSPEPQSVPRFKPSIRDAISAPIEASARQPQSQFAASHLFPRLESAYPDAIMSPSLYTRGRRNSDDLASRPPTPPAGSDEDEPALSPKTRSPLVFSPIKKDDEPLVAVTAPFRRAMEEEEREHDDAVEGLGISLDAAEGEGFESGTGTPVGESDLNGVIHEVPEDGQDSDSPPALADSSAEMDPIHLRLSEAEPKPAQADTPTLTNTVASPEVAQVHKIPTPPGTNRIRTLSTAPTDPGSSAISFPQLTHTSPLDPHQLDRKLSLAGHGERASEKINLSEPVMAYLHRMLRQCLEREAVPKVDVWEAVLMQLLLQLVEEANPDVQRGDDIDIRKYARIKKIPGGRPRDSEYVTGIVFTKNLMHKQMQRELLNARVMCFSYALEYQSQGREDQLVSLDPILKQEKESIEALTARVMTHKPHIVLVGGNVSSLALDYFVKNKVAVARFLKPELIPAIARATQGQVFASPVSWAEKTRVGWCRRFRVQTFKHPLIPSGRKTILRFEGCERHLGCTLILRGGPVETLNAVKRVLNVMMPVIYNSKLEAALTHDEQLVQPQIGAAVGADDESLDEMMGVLGEINLTERERVSREVSRVLRPYRTTAMSSSAFVRMMPPHPLARMSEHDKLLAELIRQRDDDEMQQIIAEEAASKQHEAEPQTPSLGSSSMESSVTESTTSGDAESPATALCAAELARYAIAPVNRPLRPVEDFSKILQSPEGLVKKAALLRAQARHAEHLWRLEQYQQRTKDNFDPAGHQSIAFLETVACTQAKVFCHPPRVRTFDLYGKNDCSLGQYIDRLCANVGSSCTECGRHMMVHYSTWVHGQHRVMIVPEVHEAPLDRPEWEGSIVMWSICKECDPNPGQHPPSLSGQKPMSDATYKLSFAKYLELSCYPQGLRSADGFCAHEGHLDRIRYFNRGKITLRVSVEEIDLSEIIAPPRTLRVTPTRQLELRNEEFLTVWRRIVGYYDSIDHRIHAFDLAMVQQDRHDECQAALDEFKVKCTTDRRKLLRLLETTYEHAQDGKTNGSEMTAVRLALQTRAVAWDAEWAAFEKKVIPTDVRRMTTVQLNKLFASKSGDKSSTNASSPDRKSTTGSYTASTDEGEKTEKTELTASTESEAEPTAALTPTVSSAFVSALDSAAQEEQLTSGAAEVEVPQPPQVASSTDCESDSTVTGVEPGRSSVRMTPYGPDERRALDETDESESDANKRLTPSRRTHGAHRSPTASAPNTPGVAELVNFFNDSEQPDGAEGILTKKSPTAARPGMRRGATERPRSAVKARLDSDSEDMAVAKLAVRPTKIPRQKALHSPSLAAAGRGSHALGSLFEPPEAEGEIDRSKLVVSPTGFLTFSPEGSRPSSRSNSKAGRRSPKPSVTPGSPLASPPISSKPKAPWGAGPGAGGDVPRSTAMSKGKSRQDGPALESVKLTKPSSRSRDLSRPTTSSANKVAIPRRIASGSNARVHKIASHFDKITEKAERERMRAIGFRAAVKRQARPVVSAVPTIEVFHSVRDAAKDDSDDEPSESESSDGADDEYENDDPSPSQRRPSSPHEPKMHQLLEAAAAEVEDPSGAPIGVTEGLGHSTVNSSSMLDALIQAAPVGQNLQPPPVSNEVQRTKELELGSETFSLPSSPLLPDGFSLPRVWSEGESSGTERGSIIKAISNLWTYKGGELTALEEPLLPSEHLFDGNPVLVREDEPSSIIAFALMSKTYREKLKEDESAGKEKDKDKDATNVVLERSEPFMPDESHGHVTTDTSTWGLLDVQSNAGTDAGGAEDDVALDEALQRSKTGERTFRLQFGDQTCKFHCKIFFADKFEALRRSVGIDEQFTESMARCFKWESSGGRSKVDFLKTKDDRFILKQLSRSEMDSFLIFAPAYFDHMADAVKKRKPTLLAKIFGFYRLGLTNPLTKKTVKLDVLVMENLFYDRKVDRTYDLKGSTRNRYVPATGAEREVLMDENLVENSYDQPLYVREDSKRFVRRAIHFDTKFLAEMNVMDYSLVVGVDSTRNELVVGIIDFIRTYTWDKRIETWVKDSTLLGGGSSKSGGPTIVTPREYEARFAKAMETYLVPAPGDWWHGGGEDELRQETEKDKQKQA